MTSGLYRKDKAFTLMEVVLAGTLITMMSFGIFSLLIISVREQRVGYVEQRVFENANRIQDRVTELLQGASRNAGVFFAQPTGAYYRRIVFRNGVGEPNQELIYDPDTNTLTWDPNLLVSNDEVEIGFADDPIAKVRGVRFRSALKTGGIPDSSIILVTLEVSDEGYARSAYRDISDPNNWITSTRSFAVNVRRN